MAYDGFVVAATVHELNDRLLGGSISKVAQPEKDELLLTLKVNRKAVRLTLSADPSMPLVYLRDDTEVSQPAAPGFCMALRKHISGGRIKEIYQSSQDINRHGLERVIVFAVEHYDELGDIGTKYLVTELMGRHSNIILLNDEYEILDSIRHVPSSVSSVREVLPGRKYFLPVLNNKTDPYEYAGNRTGFINALRNFSGRVSSFFSSTMTGFSSAMSYELCERAALSSETECSSVDDSAAGRLFEEFDLLMNAALEGRFAPNIIYENNIPQDISAFGMRSFNGPGFSARYYDTVSSLVIDYYREKSRLGRVRSKTEDIRHQLKIISDRIARKLELQEKQYRDAGDRERFRIYGELLNVYGYGLPEGSSELVCPNYYDNNNDIRIPLNKMLSVPENSKHYFDRYTKLKRTAAALEKQIQLTRNELYTVDSLSGELRMCENEADIDHLRNEMRSAGLIKGGSGKKAVKAEKPSEPLHFVSSDGMDIYVGRNNEQNEYLSFKLASADDYFFHAKNVPGSHVIVRTGGKSLSTDTINEAASLAAYYSKAGSARPGEKTEVDYVKRKEIRKVPGMPKGFVIYHTNSSVTIEGKPSV